ncbi:MAG: hypothetical protein ABSB19_17990 [Methylomonas sp.]|jgi:hypothetical protein
MSSEHIVGLTYADRLRLATESRHQALREDLQAELLSLTTLLGPMSDGPEWPAGPAWLAARHGRHACVISDGLSDPWVERDKPETGLGLEVYIESPDVIVTGEEALAGLADTWLFPMLAEISHTLAGNPSLCRKLRAGELSSLEFNIEHIKDGRGRVGALLNVSSRPLQLSGGEVRLVAVTLLTVGELHYLRGKGDAGRRQLADKLQTSGVGHLSVLSRPELI